ncbi:methylated-DNA--[protein]-cysteine S-methyltransferase [Jannaschia sp. M317]|uniref:methylated-DNA--[protein]-cysteine S-methyltransferase n=1 Tax=Jannaschia sp. M317 TaxID=2867011 RepID=UPI0021A92412|nr:methylated-DNA--[protein]-cysteine S-methyltransferase [Jannaschia sp. M317]UWQ18810.1 methylated-DNA--[protein]-cysteine S-methyltransferase [Jannaschia sp. M317]
MTRLRTTLDTPLGPLGLAGLDGELTHLCWPGADLPDGRDDPTTLPEARAQLTAYFDGRLTRFTLPLAPEGTPFQRTVWQALTDIPLGQTCTYADIARAIGKPGGTQAVGQANGRNPIPIIIPCHRVVAADGGIGGFSGGLNVKRALLQLEGASFEAEQPRLI